MTDDGRPKPDALRRGWTTGACATASASAAYTALLSGTFPDPAVITLPGDQRVAFALATTEQGDGWARAGVIKDAGDDPDVTHGALVLATVRHGATGTGIVFRAGAGVGIVTRPGLPIPPGEPAINPVPRAMIRAALDGIAQTHGVTTDIDVELSIPNGERLAERTLNGRLGIVGGLSILGTTGIVIPFSCAAWIHTIHRSIDVARASGVKHVAGSTGSTSEAAIRKLYGLPDIALIEMGDFVGGMLKYLRTHPVSKVTLAGGFAKMTKLAQGLLDLHSGRGNLDFGWLADQAAEVGADPDLQANIRTANTASEVYALCVARNIQLGEFIAERAWHTAVKTLDKTDVTLDVVIFDRTGDLIARSRGSQERR